MDRRDWLKFASGLVATTATGGTFTPYLSKFGATRPVVVAADKKSFHTTFRPFKGVSKDIDKNVFLFHNLQKEIGEIIPHYQGPVEIDGVVYQGEGDCVGQSAAMGCDVLAATNIHLFGKHEKFIAKSSVEMLYAGSRFEIGTEGFPDQNPNKVNWLMGRGGSHGEWVAKFLKDYGVLHRLKYEKGENSIDLRGYNPQRSRKYRDIGVPDWLEAFAKQHPVREVTNVLSGSEGLDAICAGQPIIMCSSYGFASERDAEGFAKMYTGRFRPQWWHAMVATGAILKGKRPGAIIQNSHGVWNSGPRPYDMPEGSFAVDASHFDTMIKDWFDCYALSSYKGHEAKKMRHKLYLR